jgi:alpha-beta hydrolase superfamily lysophospholipase
VNGTARRLLFWVSVLLVAASPSSLSAADKLNVSVRGRTLTLAIYRPPARPAGTVLMGSGDVGWVGLAVSLADELCAQGYLVVGLNTRQYLSSFTSAKSHLQPADLHADFRTIRDALASQGLLVHPVILSGVSEGAALSVLAASDAANHTWIDGVITMGLPATAELAWRWTDVTAWISKRDADEPSFAPGDVIGGVAPVPLWMIQSKKDEYVSPEAYALLFARAGEPKQLTIIDASNHRFTDKRAELSTAYASGLTWISKHAAKGAGP